MFDVSALPTPEEIQARINQRYDDLFMKDKNGKLIPFVCTICDEFLMNDDDVCCLPAAKLKKMKKTFSWTSLDDSERIKALEDVFCLKDDTRLLGDSTWLSGMALSPRGRVFRKNVKHARTGFTCCRTCKSNVEKTTLPMNAIINKNYVGGAPACLTELTEVEQALIAPVKHHGYCFTWTGGKQKCMKGTLVFMRVKERRVAKAVANFEYLGLTKHIIVMTSGNMTNYQKKKAVEKSVIRTDKVIAAVEWLCQNHKLWKHIDLNALRDELSRVKPTVLDHSNVVESENANVEEEELFSCYYPEGAATPDAGGFDEVGAFKKYVEELKEKEFDLEFKVNLEKAFVKGDDNDQLISACLLQFPCGVGGMDETRSKKDGSLTDSIDMKGYLEHLSKVSQPCFQTPLFQLIAYTLISKNHLLDTSRLQLKGETNAKNLAEGLNVQDLRSAINGRRRGQWGGTQVSNTLLNAVDACSRALPHTNDAAKKARGIGEAIGHHFGDGAVFLTVTFDDQNSLLMQVLTQKEIDDDALLKDLSDEEMNRRKKARKAVRLDFPGAAAIHFEMLLTILTEEVVGWDMKRNQPTEKPGFFGDVYAFTMAIEEQGRKTLHGHMTLYIDQYKEVERTMFFAANERAKKDAGAKMQRYYDHVASTTLMSGSKNVLLTAWDHDCRKERKDRKLPEVVTEQTLRDFRHKHGHTHNEGVFAACPEGCGKTWTYETLLADYLKNGNLYCQAVGAAKDTVFDYTEGDIAKSVPRDRLLAHVVQFQKEGVVPEDAPKTIINSVYQHHLSCHTKGCFKCNKKRKHICGPRCECRYRLPDKKRTRTVMKIDSERSPWYEWSGNEKTQPICQLLPKRGTYDLFQNISCPAMSESKMACNSNVSIILAGPIAQYQFKYQMKGTQDDDTAEYEKVHYAIKTLKGRVHESDRSEALRLICRAAFAHNKTNVISAPMASYLLRHKTRFYFSHPVQYCPLNDVVKIHEKKAVSGTLQYTQDGRTYFENQALHYLCRPASLEFKCLKDFTENFYVLGVTGGKKKKKNDTPVEAFLEDSGFFKHPSAVKDKSGSISCKQGVKERKQKVLAKVSQWMFPDTASFKSPITSAPLSDMSPKMEKYAKLVLTLLLPHRSIDDLVLGSTYPHTHKLQEVYKEDMVLKMSKRRAKLFTDQNCQYLQNIQNAAYNSTRYRINTDELEACTVPFTKGDDVLSEDPEEEEDLLEMDYEALLEQLDIEVQAPPNDDDPAFLNESLKGLTLRKLRNKGGKKCGYINELQVPEAVHPSSNSRPFLVTVGTRNDVADPDSGFNYELKRRKKYAVKRVVTLFMKRTRPKLRKNVWDGKDITVREATGSIESIREWGAAAFSSDEKQRRAFECIIASFILTFYEDSEDGHLNANCTNNDRSKYRQMEKALLELKGDDKKKQLIGLLHGPGGSGKSTVINMVKAYAKAYCDSLGHTFTSRTIVVTAMSGVAATLLGGETAHSVLGLNNKGRPFTDAEKDEFVDCRLIVIDEISFASAKNFTKIQINISQLMRKRYHLYGGTNMLFAGDYSQLEPVNQTTVYNGDNCPEFHDHMNTYIELDGTWRFKDDPVWGERMLRFREGVPTLDDVNTINNACDIDFKPPPRNTQVATHRNRDRDAVNSSIFDEYCIKNRPQDDSVLTSAIVVLMDQLEIHTSKKTYTSIDSNMVKRYFYEHCGEDDCKMGEHARGRVDPLLKLYPGCPMMLTKNTDVPNGQANGSRARVQSVNVKVGEQTFDLTMENGTTVRAVYASQVQSITVEHENEEIRPRQFNVEAESFTFTCNLTIGTEEVKTPMRGQQFPIISNSCTTGHKLQGCTIKSLLVNDWHYGQNWTYVVLSRVKTMAGLHLRALLTTDLKRYAMSPKMVTMLQKFRDSVSLKRMSQKQYDDLIAKTTNTNLYNDIGP